MSKALTVEEQIAQAVAKQNNELALKQEQREENKFSLGARIIAKDIIQGSPIMDKSTNQQKLDALGEPACYPNKFKLTVQFMGAELQSEVKQDLYDSVEEMRTYYCEGYIGEVKKYGSSFIEPIFRKFTTI